MLLTTTRWLCLFLLILCSGSVTARTIIDRDSIEKGGYIISLHDKVVEQYNPTSSFTPASTIKLLTVLTGMELLGPEYRFTTGFYLDSHGRLVVVGGGDPLLTSEAIATIVKRLKEIGVKKIRGYVLDDTLFALEQSVADGSLNSPNPYDAPNSALAVNFNSVSILKRKDGTVASGEQQTPTTLLAREIGSALTSGSHRVNVGAYQLSGHTPPGLRFVAELLHATCLKLGIDSELEITRRKNSPANRHLFTYTSEKDYQEIARLCLHYSSNFVANQVALMAGGKRYGFPATWEKARRALMHTARKRYGIPVQQLTVVEGSGLSRQTLATPRAIHTLLKAFEQYRELLPMRSGSRRKSGTLEGVYCYTGYLETSTGRVLYTILLNQQVNQRDRLFGQIKHHFRKYSANILPETGNAHPSPD